MDIQILVDRFLNSPAYLKQGAGHLAKTWNVKKESVYKAKERAKEILYNNESAQLHNIIHEQEEQIAVLTSCKDTEESGVRSSTKTFESRRILTQSEIKELSGVDDITCRLGMVWNKLQPNGNWTYSIQVIYLLNNFYSNQEMKEKLKELFPDKLEPYKIPDVDFFDKGTAVFLYISDDHIGLQYKNSLYDNAYTPEIYEERIQKIITYLLNVSGNIEHLYIVRLGDELDGYNGKTTRYDHDLKSLSNKEQFDIYTKVNKRLYDTILSSGIAKNYSIIVCNNSNHSGKGFSYVVNKAIEFYFEGKYPEVEFKSIEKFIDILEWGNHAIAVTHGKDEEFMKAPFPLNLNDNVDGRLYDFFLTKGFSPKEKWCRLVKGDIHKYNVNEGRFGTYVNVPSIAGGSQWIEHNFGNSKPGALIEYVVKDEESILSLPIKF